MAEITAGKAYCATCGQQKQTFRCEDCLQTFCYKHVTNHHDELSRQLYEVESSRDLLQQRLNEHTTELEKHPLMQRINEWECNSIKTIRHAAEEAKQLLHKHISEHTNQIQIEANKLTHHIQQSRKEDDFSETDLDQWKEQLTRLTEQLLKLPNITVRQDLKSLVSKICVDVSYGWIRDGITVAAGNERGDGLNQLCNPYGIYVDDDQTIYIADWSNHRIVAWKCDATSGEVVAGGNGQGDQTNQLNRPTDVTVDKKRDCLIICDLGNRRIIRWPRRNGTSGEIIISDLDCHSLTMNNDGCFYISDHIKQEVRLWREGDRYGRVIAGGNGKGNNLNQLNCPTYTFIDQNHSVFVSDYNNHRVMKWMKDSTEGIVVAGNQGKGDVLTQLSGPQQVVVDRLGAIYVADCGNHRVMRWPNETTQGDIVVGGSGHEKQPDQLYNPTGLSFDTQCNLYVADWGNQRIQKFFKDPNYNS